MQYPLQKREAQYSFFLARWPWFKRVLKIKNILLNIFWLISWLKFFLTIYRAEYTYILCLSIWVSWCLGLCLFVSNERQNGWTDRVHILCGTSRDPRAGMFMNMLLKFYFCKILKMCEKIIWNPQTFFFTIREEWRCSQIKHQLKVEKEDGCEAPYQPSKLNCTITLQPLQCGKKKIELLNLKKTNNIFKYNIFNKNVFSFWYRFLGTVPVLTQF